MKRHLLVLVALSTTACWAAERVAAQAAAAASHPEIVWDDRSTLHLNFTCRGKKELALMGRTKPIEVLVDGRPITTSRVNVVVAVFTGGTKSAPSLFESQGLSEETTVLTIESYSAADIKEAVGTIPRGLKLAKSCRGLRLYDGERDSIHLYWNHESKTIAGWSL